MVNYFLSTGNLLKFVARLLESVKVVAPVRYGNHNILHVITPEDIKDIRLAGFRTIENLKAHTFQLSENVDNCPEPRPVVLLGARGCDLEGLEVMDRVLLGGEIKDPFYEAYRRNLTIIGADCTGCGDTCFCTMVNGQPYPTKLFDLNLTPLKEGFFVEVGSEKGRSMVEANPELFNQAVSEEKREEKIKVRGLTVKLLAETNQRFQLKRSIADLHKRNLTNKVWRTLTKDCVECSACNFTCPTCSCFLLLDSRPTAHPVSRDPARRDNSRFKIWDACLKAGYARVAGGGNPRGKLFERLQNRYHCKFDYSYDRLERYACVGCGRCIDACAGNIDMRKIFLELERQVSTTARLA